MTGWQNRADGSGDSREEPAVAYVPEPRERRRPPDPEWQARAADLLARGREIRRRAGVGMDAMAFRCGFSKPTLQAYETAPPKGLAADPAGYPAATTWLAALAVLDETNAGLPGVAHAAGRRCWPARTRWRRCIRNRPAGSPYDEPCSTGMAGSRA